MKIKFNNVQDLSDARYASAAMAEWIGFTVGEIPLAQVQEIIGWCAGPKLTLELTDQNQKETAISWCTILQVDAIECMAIDLEFWQENIPNENIEWLSKNNNITTVIGESSTAIHKVDLHLHTAQDIKNQNHEAISLDCKKESVVGMKNYDLWNDLLETLEIW